MVQIADTVIANGADPPYPGINHGLFPLSSDVWNMKCHRAVHPKEKLLTIFT